MLALLPVLTAAAGTALLCLTPHHVWKLPVSAAIWALALCLSYVALETRLLPLVKTDRLYAALSGEGRETVEGVYLGLREEATIKRGVRMRAMRIETGRRLKNVPVPQEILFPAVVQLTLSAGESLRLEAADGILLALPPGYSAAIRPRGGRYRVSGLILALLAALATAVCFCASAAVQRKAVPPSVDIAVCTPAYHPEAEQALLDAAAESGLRLAFSYTTTLEQETLFSYLSTYGALDAELLMMPASLYRSVFAYDTPVLDASGLPGASFLTNEAGQGTALVLSDPPAGNLPFPALTDWIAVPQDDAYVLAIGPSVTDAQRADAADTVQLLARCLSAFDFFQQ